MEIGYILADTQVLLGNLGALEALEVSGRLNGVLNGPIQCSQNMHGLWLNCLQKLDECSFARAHKRFTTVCMLSFFLKFSTV